MKIDVDELVYQAMSNALKAHITAATPKFLAAEDAVPVAMAVAISSEFFPNVAKEYIYPDHYLLFNSMITPFSYSRMNNTLVFWPSRKA